MTKMFSVYIERTQTAYIDVEAATPEQAVELALAQAPDQNWDSAPEYRPIAVE